jgi:hypothetical protein
LEDQQQHQAVEYLIESEEKASYHHEEVDMDTQANHALEEEATEIDDVYYEEEVVNNQDTNESVKYSFYQNNTPKIVPANSELDDWLSIIKSSLLSLTKLNRARAKQEINNIISKYEIEELV